MHVDRAGQDMHAGDIDGFFCGWHRLGRANGQDFPVLDRDAGVNHGIRRDDLAAGEDEIGADAHSAAHPPSTGRSAPVI